MTDPQPIDSHPVLRAGVDALRSLEPDYDVEAGLQRFEHAVGSDSAPAPVRKRFAIVTAAVVLAAAALVGARASESSRSLAPGLVSLTPVASAPPVDLPASAPLEPIVTPVERTRTMETAMLAAEAKVASKPRRARASAPARPEPQAVDAAPAADDSLAREMALLDKTRREVVAGEANTARETIARARTTLARLRFDEEWDALEILALADAGELTQAEARASAFLVAHPNGRFDDSIERALVRARARR
ncbi:MAG: hypothetical protein IAG13_35875 [Deltaproteobacteria bacterium]|nr:hypothetical protein [Nannocystaceae bacterium]